MANQDFTVENLLRYLKSYPGVLFLKDAQGKYCYTSDLCEWLKAEEGVGIIGKTDLEVQKAPELGCQYYEEDQKLLREGGSYKCYSEVKTEKGSAIYEIKCSAVQDDSGNTLGIIGTVVDVTREVELLQQVKKQYVTDAVTGVYNHKYLEEWLLSKQIVYPFSLITCDCNRS